MVFRKSLKNLLSAKVPAIYIETTEWERFYAELDRVKDDKIVKRWNPLDGGDFEKIDFVAMVKLIIDGKDRCDIAVIEYADTYLKDDEAAIQLGIILRKLRTRNQQIIFVAPTLCLPKSISNEVAVLDLPLPSRAEIKVILRAVAEEFSIEGVDTANEILDSVQGLSTTEIRNAFAKVAVANGKITADEISDLHEEKEQIIRKSGYLEYIRPDTTMQQIGGLEKLKAWLEQRKIAFGYKAREKKLQLPKGVMLLGIPGTGKSISAKAVASIWDKPLLRLDMAKIFGGLVGESESNMRNTIKVAESLEPCILWVDEIEKGLSGGQGGERDGGTSTRVLGSFLTWMQEKKKEVFIFATANDVSKLPPELLRKGRFDEIFFVDLPDEKARKQIFEIHLSAIDQGHDMVSDELIRETEAYSGAEIESIVHEAHFMAHNEQSDRAKITAKHLLDCTKATIPLARIMCKPIEKLRELAAERYRKASEAKPPKIEGIEGPHFKQETNIFIADRQAGEHDYE